MKEYDNLQLLQYFLLTSILYLLYTKKDNIFLIITTINMINCTIVLYNYLYYYDEID